MDPDLENLISQDDVLDSTEPGSADREVGSETETSHQTEPEEDYILRIVFEERQFALEKGIHKGGVIRFTKISNGILSQRFNPVLVESDYRPVFKDIKQLVETVSAQTARLSIVLPDEWGRVFTMPHPGSRLSDEELIHHIAWRVRISGWEDDEPFRFNFSTSDEEQIVVVAIRDRIFDFAEKIADALSGRLLQLSLKKVTDLNIISQDLRMEIEPVEQTPAKPEEEVEEVIEVGEKKTSYKLLFIPLLVLIILILLYLLSRQMGLNIPLLSKKQSAAIEIEEMPAEIPVELEPGAAPPTVEESPATIPADSAAPTLLPFSESLSLLSKGGGLSYCSFTESSALCEMQFNSRTEIERLLNILAGCGVVKTAQEVSPAPGGRLSALLTLDFQQSLLDGYIGVPVEQVRSIITAGGYPLDDDIFTGTIEQARTLMALLEERKIAFYRITLNRISAGVYRMKLEF